MSWIEEKLKDSTLKELLLQENTMRDFTMHKGCQRALRYFNMKLISN